MTEWIICRLCEWPAESRRHWAMRFLIWSVALAVLNVGLYLAGIINVDHLILVTLVLSWLALTVTFADIVIGTDVRVEVEVEETGPDGTRGTSADDHDGTDQGAFEASSAAPETEGEARES